MRGHYISSGSFRYTLAPPHVPKPFIMSFTGSVQGTIDMLHRVMPQLTIFRIVLLAGNVMLRGTQRLHRLQQTAAMLAGICGGMIAQVFPVIPRCVLDLANGGIDLGNGAILLRVHSRITRLAFQIETGFAQIAQRMQISRMPAGHLGAGTQRQENCQTERKTQGFQ